MTLPIGLASYQSAALANPSTSKSQGPISFGDVVSQFVGQTNQQQMTADESVKQLVTGQTEDVQQVVLAVAQADLSFQLFMEIRNKLIDNYNELMRMQF
jgi:flagellar hook-basal body complex protein FliE